MITNQLVGYIKQQFANGKNEADIIAALTAAGWELEDIKKGLAQAQTMEASPLATLATNDPSTNSLAANAPVVAATTATSNKPSKKRKLLLVLSVIVILGLASGGSAFGYFYAFPSPDRVLNRVKQRISQVESVSYIGSLEAALQGQDNASATIKFDGAFDIKDINTIKDAKFRNTITLEKVSSDSNFTQLIKTPISLSVTVLDQVLYLKLKLADPKVNLILFAVDLSPVNNKWIVVDLKELQKNEVSRDEFLQEFPIDPNKIPQEVSDGLSQEQIAQIKEAYQSAKLFTGKRLKSEKIGGVNTHHLALTVDKQGLLDFSNKVALIIDPSKKEEIDQINYDEEQKALKTLDDLKIELWVGKWDSMPRKVLWSWTYTDPEDSSQSFTIKDETFFKDFNKPVNIKTPPPPHKTLKEAFMEVLQQVKTSSSNNNPYLPTITKPSATAHPLNNNGTDSDNDGLSDAVESFWKTDPHNPDTDGDGYTDYEELNNLYDPLGPGKLNMGEGTLPSNNPFQFNDLNSNSNTTPFDNSYSTPQNDQLQLQEFFQNIQTKLFHPKS